MIFASVLGAVNTDLGSTDDLDKITSTGIYKFSGQTPKSCPITMGILIVYSANLNSAIKTIIQVACDTRNGMNKESERPLYYRVAWTDSINGWSKWAQISYTAV